MIQCYASRVGVGGVLYQIDDENKERPIAFVSQKLNGAERNYTVTELECLAAIVCIKRSRPFRVITDHSSLQWLMSVRDLSGRLARWSLHLQGFDYAFNCPQYLSLVKTTVDTPLLFSDLLTTANKVYKSDLFRKGIDNEEASL